MPHFPQIQLSDLFFLLVLTGFCIFNLRLIQNRCDYSSVPTVVFTPLEYAACGLSEERANLTFGQDNIEVYHDYYWPLEWTIPGRDKNSCYVKVVCHIPNNRVLGLHVMGPNAGDIVQGFVAAMKCGLTKQQLDATVGLHPVSAKVSVPVPFPPLRNSCHALAVKAQNFRPLLLTYIDFSSRILVNSLSPP
uniref:Thioredoxin reductase 1, cytoplasmic n=1 Tax=Myripristis murdjan TaxID=586833 RepID=A0A668AK17_9TELE